MAALLGSRGADRDGGAPDRLIASGVDGVSRAEPRQDAQTLQAEDAFLRVPGGGQLAEMAQADAPGQPRLDDRADDAGGEQGERQRHAHRALAALLGQSDRLDARASPGHEIPHPGPACGDA